MVVVLGVGICSVGGGIGSAVPGGVVAEVFVAVVSAGGSSSRSGSVVLVTAAEDSSITCWGS